MKKSMIVLLCVFVLGIFLTKNTNAACTYRHWGIWFVGPNSSCNECANSSCCSGDLCFTLGPLMFKPQTDYVLSENGQAWLVQGTKKTQFASDNLDSFIKSMSRKYEKANRDNPDIKKEMENAWREFDKNPDNGIVSPTRLSAFQKEMGLEIRNENNANKLGEPKKIYRGDSVSVTKRTK